MIYLTRRRALGAAASTLAVSLAGRAAFAADPVEIPVLISLTGPFAFLGKKETESYQIAEALVNRTGGIQGRPLHFAINDIQSNPTVAVQVANQVLERKPAIITGLEPGAAAQAVIPLLKDQTVMYTISSSAKLVQGGFAFASSPDTRVAQVAGIRFLRGRGVKRLGILASTDVTGADQIAMIEEALKLPENSGVTIVATERFAVADIGVQAQVARLKAATPEGVWIGTTGSGFGTALRGLSDAGIGTLPIMTNAGNALRAQADQYKSFMPRDTYFSGPLRFMERGADVNRGVRNAQNVFYDNMRAAGTPRPDVGDNTSWDLIQIAVGALRKLGPNATGPDVHRYMLALQGFPVTNGVMDFRDGSGRGLGLDANIIVRWDATKDDFIAASEPGGAPLRGR
jgi:branched-chain amino acid transport system substrate-binding protein